MNLDRLDREELKQIIVGLESRVDELKKQNVTLREVLLSRPKGWPDSVGQSIIVDGSAWCFWNDKITKALATQQPEDSHES